MTDTSAATGRAQARASADAKPRLGWIIALTSTAYFMVVLDSSVLITALPRIQRDLGVGLSSLQWTFNAYGIAFAAGIITAAALGDRFGRRRLFNGGIALFTIASAACALAPNAGELIAARTVQGLGRRHRAADQPDDPDDGVPPREARDDRRRLRRPRRTRGRARARRRRDRHRRDRLALDLLAQRADRGRRRRPRPAPAPRELRRTGTARSDRRRFGHVRRGGARSGRSPAPTTSAGRAPKPSSRSPSAASCSPRSSPGKTTSASRWCRCGCSRSASSPSGT